MESIITNEKDERFIELTKELDNIYYMNIGEESFKYKDYNNLNNPNVVCLVLNWGKPIACGAFRLFDKDSIEIRRLYVKPRYRKKGIGYKIVKQLEKLAIEENFRFSYIVAGKENENAINLYKKLGYEFIDNFGIFKDDDLCVCMKKEFKSLIF